MQARARRRSHLAGPRSMTESIDDISRCRRAPGSRRTCPPKTPPHDGPEAREFALAWQQTQARGGWAGLSWPKEVGGRGASVLEQIVWFEEYARARAPSPLSRHLRRAESRRPDADRVRHARAEGLPPAEDPGRRSDLVPGFFRAGRGLRPRESQDARQGRGRRARHRRPEDSGRAMPTSPIFRSC